MYNYYPPSYWSTEDYRAWSGYLHEVVALLEPVYIFTKTADESSGNINKQPICCPVLNHFCSYDINPRRIYIRLYLNYHPNDIKPLCLRQDRPIFFIHTKTMACNILRLVSIEVPITPRKVSVFYNVTVNVIRTMHDER